MKSKYSFIPLLALALGLSACDNNSNGEYNVLAIAPIDETPHVIYADQTVDSCVIISTNDWTASVTSDWMTLKPEYASAKVEAGGVLYKHIAVNYDINKTNAVRYGVLRVNNNKHTVGRQDMQTYWLNITSPTPVFTNKETYAGVRFVSNVSSQAQSNRIAFTTYSPTATISTEANWVSLPDSAYAAGSHAINAALLANTTGANRTAQLVLKTSNGIADTIQIVQSR